MFIDNSRFACVRGGGTFWACCGLIVAFMLTSAAARAVVFTGDAAGDFPPANFVEDGAGGLVPDVGVPPHVDGGEGIVSGWDIKGLYFDYAPAADTASFGVDFFVIAGDADGRNGPNVTSAQLISIGGQDTADLARSESIAVLLDLNRDGLFDVIAGVPSGNPGIGNPLDCDDFDLRDCFGLFDYLDLPDVAPGFRFAAKREEPVVLGFFPGPDSPDFEFAIPAWSALMAQSGINLEPCEAFSIDVLVFAGSFFDAGVGEDYVPVQGGMVTLNFPPSDSESCTCPNDLLDAEEGLQSCQAQVSTLNGALADAQHASNLCGVELQECKEAVSMAGIDSDDDGIPDIIDQCPETGTSLVADLLGCSQAQFCANFDGRGWRDRLRCKAADWQNDEPLWARDCQARRGSCVPR